MFLGVVGIAALIILNPFGKPETATVSNNQKPTETPVLTRDNQNNELKEKLANLEKQIQDQKIKRNLPILSLFRVRRKTIQPCRQRVSLHQTTDFFRSEPSQASKPERSLSKYRPAQPLIWKTAKKIIKTIDGRSGRWCMVSYAGEIGWAFDAWLIY